MLDGMTNIKASEVLKELKDYTEDLPHYSPDEVAEALELANKALETHEGDLISREDAKMKIREKFKDLPTRCEINEVINDLPSATPQKVEGDLISRAELLRVIGEEPENWTDSDREIQAVSDYIWITETVKNMPSVTPQPKVGRWIKKYADSSNEYYECSSCGHCEEEWFDIAPYCGECGSYNGGER